MVDPGPPDEFLGGPLRLVVGRSTVRPGPEEAQHNYPLHTRSSGGLNHSPGTVDVYAIEGLVSDLSIDTGTVHHDLTPGECRRQASASSICTPVRREITTVFSLPRRAAK
ncbi:hypothetical protein StoSoilA2_39770 [Arthrobacter sp. StoSoilA2]|nr:hypothetical protein StoSoilA2_39770 [Arthrobacter sp. StoSoilA2]